MVNVNKFLILVFVIVFTVPSCFSKRFYFNGHYWDDINHKKLLTEHQSFPDLWFNQTLDHFGQSTVKWMQRYFVNKQYYRLGGPAFIQIGGEGTADPIWMDVGSWIEYAKEMGAMCFLLEHRYYGKSRPTPDMSTLNLQWLSSKQALADLASFRIAMTKEHNLQNAKWVTFGGSYPGSLSAWFRLKYPQLVDVAVSSSAPLQALVDFTDYQVVAGQSIAKLGGLGCYQNITTASDQVKQMLQHPMGMRTVSSSFKLCNIIDATNLNDVANFFTTIAGNFDGVIQYNRDNRAFEGARGTNITISSLCDIMTRPLKSPFQSYADVNSLMMSVNEQSCLDISYANSIKELQETSWNSSAASGARQWTYQTCNEFGFYQSSDAKNQPFGDQFPVGFSVQQCADIYGKNFNLTRLLKGINSTNAYYGSKNYTAENVIFLNGSIDPWHALGMTQNGFRNGQLIIFIEDTAHCANMYPASPNDRPQLIAARQQVAKTLKFWLQAQ